VRASADVEAVFDSQVADTKLLLLSNGENLDELVAPQLPAAPLSTLLAQNPGAEALQIARGKVAHARGAFGSIPQFWPPGHLEALEQAANKESDGVDLLTIHRVRVLGDGVEQEMRDPDSTDEGAFLSVPADWVVNSFGTDGQVLGAASGGAVLLMPRGLRAGKPILVGNSWTLGRPLDADITPLLHGKKSRSEIFGRIVARRVTDGPNAGQLQLVLEEPAPLGAYHASVYSFMVKLATAVDDESVDFDPTVRAAIEEMVVQAGLLPPNR
jgi:hypothetical protein